MTAWGQLTNLRPKRLNWEILLQSCYGRQTAVWTAPTPRPSNGQIRGTHGQYSQIYVRNRKEESEYAPQNINFSQIARKHREQKLSSALRTLKLWLLLFHGLLSLAKHHASESLCISFNGSTDKVECPVSSQLRCLKNVTKEKFR